MAKNKKQTRMIYLKSEVIELYDRLDNKSETISELILKYYSNDLKSLQLKEKEISEQLLDVQKRIKEIKKLDNQQRDLKNKQEQKQKELKLIEEKQAKLLKLYQNDIISSDEWNSHFYTSKDGPELSGKINIDLLNITLEKHKLNL